MPGARGAHPASGTVVGGSAQSRSGSGNSTGQPFLASWSRTRRRSLSLGSVWVYSVIAAAMSLGPGGADVGPAQRLGDLLDLRAGQPALQQGDEGHVVVLGHPAGVALAQPGHDPGERAALLGGGVLVLVVTRERPATQHQLGGHAAHLGVVGQQRGRGRVGDAAVVVQAAQHVEGAVTADPLLEHGEQCRGLVVGHAVGVSLTDPLQDRSGQLVHGRCTPTCR